MVRRPDTLERIQRRVTRLIGEFSECLASFDSKEPFTGPSLYFHLKTMEVRRQYPTGVGAIQDDAFFEYLYATLTAWGMHRMGGGDTKLVDLDKIVDAFRRQTYLIAELDSAILTDLELSSVGEVAHRLWTIISGLGVSRSKTQLVAGSKALHHVLPSLVPPIDRQYTLRFFYGYDLLGREDGERAFVEEMFPCFHQIAVNRADTISVRVEAAKGMDTSITKVIDNAIVGFVRSKRQ